MNEPSRHCASTGASATDPWRELARAKADETTLTALCVAALPWCPESLNADRPGGFPRGRPAKSTVRAAAADLLARTARPSDDLARTRHVIALLSLHYQPQESAPVPLGGSELDQRVRDCTLAWRMSIVIADPAVELMTAATLCPALRNAGQARVGAMEILQPVVDRIDLTENAGALLLRDAPFLPEPLPQRIRSRALHVLARAYLDAQRVADATTVTDALVAHTATYVGAVPGQHASALSLLATVARRRRDVRTFLAAEAQLKQMAEARPDVNSVFHELNATGSGNAIRLHDHGRAWTLRLHRLHARIRADLGVEYFADTSALPSIDGLRQCLRRYRERGSKDGLTWLLAHPAPDTEILSAKFYGLSAEWWWRTIGASEDATHRSEVEAAATEAIRRLRPAGVSIDPKLETIARCAAAWCRAIGQNPRGQMKHLLAAIGCVAELMVTIGTDDDRRELADRFGYLFADAAASAVALNDHAAADLIMEAARRDRVGLILAELARNPEVDVAIRATALAVSASSTASLERPDGDIESSGDSTRSAPIDLEQRSAHVLANRAGARCSADAVLGPLGALCDPSVLEAARAEALIAGAPRRDTTIAVLQLLPLSGTDRSGAATVPVLRRLTYRADAATNAIEYVDLVDVPRSTTDLAPGDQRIFDWRETFAKALLPPPLRELPARVTTDPIRLLIVPTGFFHVPFDAMPVSADSSVLDRAAVSVHGSLTSAPALLDTELVSVPSPLLAVYDETRLRHAGQEFRALHAAISPVTRVEGADQLRGALAPEGARLSVLAMGVHGRMDRTGWGQTKLMPDGSEITATQMLALRVPVLCVLASCYSSVTTHDGVELDGFPLALMLRGAATVIGGLFNIEDEATAQIMTRFWRRMAEGVPPVYALWEAKLEWLAERPDRRSRHRLWAGLITYGCAHH
ncbi:CHAT domain-containing protein [Nocardia arizonensis]|uniref:CHAT domain-containing protein n=1 Tax=Nocardia arizonensis TaxID=1141647 RepID=UPI0006D0B74F|nr:CHAT domain-containing protein [Nocardia arizonensis]